MLERNIKIRKNLRVRRHQLDERIAHRPRKRVQETNPGDVWRGVGKRLQKAGESILLAEVASVVGGILRDENHLVDACLLKAARVFEDFFHRAADEGSLDAGNGAKRAGAAAAICNFEIRASAEDVGAERTALILADGRRFGQVIERAGRAVLPRRADDLGDIHPSARTENGIHAGDLRRDLLAVSLREASRRNQRLPLAFFRGEVSQRGEGFFSRGRDESACIDDKHIGIFRAVGGAVAFAAQKLRHGI